MVQCCLLENLKTHGMQENPWATAAIKRFSINLLHKFRQITAKKTTQLHFLIWRYLNSDHRQNEHKSPPSPYTKRLPTIYLTSSTQIGTPCFPFCPILSLFSRFLIGFDRGDESNVRSLMEQAAYEIHVRSFSNWRVVPVTYVRRYRSTPNYIWILLKIQLTFRCMYTPPRLQQTVC